MCNQWIASWLLGRSPAGNVSGQPGARYRLAAGRQARRIMRSPALGIEQGYKGRKPAVMAIR